VKGKPSRQQPFYLEASSNKNAILLFDVGRELQGRTFTSIALVCQSLIQNTNRGKRIVTNLNIFRPSLFEGHTVQNLKNK
jgi:hypothetical protein